MRISLPQKPWHGNTFLDIDLPEDWQVEYCPMAGERDPALSLAQIEDSILNPIGASVLTELAEGKKNAVIVFDDMTRPTRAYEIAPVLVRQLGEAGLEDDQITFVCALGTHGALTMADFRKKLGSEIIERHRVYNHNIYENCLALGTTSRGTKLLLNRHFVEADLKIGIGCVTAHAQVGFSGGGKLMLPGIAHIDSISHYHLEVEALAKETTGMGRHQGNILRAEINEAAAMAGLDFSVNVTVNGRGETTRVFCGDMQQTHDQAVETAKGIYATKPRPQGMDVVVANAFSKPNELAIAILLGASSLKDGRGCVVVIANSPEGQVPHYLLGRFGSGYGGRQYPITAIPETVQLVIVTEYPDKTIADWFSNPDHAVIASSWPEVLDIIRPAHGPGSRAAVLPNATMQYFAE